MAKTKVIVATAAAAKKVPAKKPSKIKIATNAQHGALTGVLKDFMLEHDTFVSSHKAVSSLIEDIQFVVEPGEFKAPAAKDLSVSIKDATKLVKAANKAASGLQKALAKIRKAAEKGQVAKQSPTTSKLDPWAAEMSKVIKTVEKNADTGMAGMGSADGYWIPEIRSNKIMAAFKAAGFTVKSSKTAGPVGGWEVTSTKNPKAGVVISISDEEDDQHIYTWFDESDS